MKTEPNAATDLWALLTNPIWPTAVLWVLLLLSGAIAFSAWQRQPYQRTPRGIGIWLLRLAMGIMWWQQSLWKIPPNYDGLLMALNLWFGLYSAPGEWPWTYGYLIVIQALFLIDPPGRCPGLDSRYSIV